MGADLGMDAVNNQPYSSYTPDEAKTVQQKRQHSDKKKKHCPKLMTSQKRKLKKSLMNRKY